MMLHEMTIMQAAAKIASKSVSPVELTESVLKRIEQIEPHISAFSAVVAEMALDQAKLAEDQIASGEYRGPLHGIPIALKDLVDYANVPTTASSKVRADYVPTTDSAVAERLRKAGAIVVGKTHTHEFAYGTITPTTRNPWDTSKIPGGSSGGSAAAVATGESFMAIGTDTGGSIRVPAAVCGIVGLKPTYGRVSRQGVTSLSWSLDHVGPLTRTVKDAAVVLNELAGYDAADPATVHAPVPDYLDRITGEVKGLRIGVPVNFYTERVHPDVSNATANAIGELARLGADIREVEIPMADAIISTEWGLLVPEASSYHQQMLRDRGDLYTDDVRTFLEAGELVLATDYIKAMRVRNIIRTAFRDLFSDIDVLIAPTVPAPALSYENPEVTWPDGNVEGGTIAYVRFSAPANVTGLPALSVPAGFSQEGLPIGIQIIGRPFDEETVLNVGHAYETATQWPTLAPL
ncbi:amidase [Rhodococcus pyridinivorans]|uniref:amidase n=1 Tax=Rhodococcus pyridinivorans TaxID=103816 RepID=UPI00207857B6|nr:amidase [Rhodococcus pyridinivorans]USI93100.1 amidase [Rhodococcus pyridinivorans]